MWYVPATDLIGPGVAQGLKAQDVGGGNLQERRVEGLELVPNRRGGAQGAPVLRASRKGKGGNGNQRPDVVEGGVLNRRGEHANRNVLAFESTRLLRVRRGCSHPSRETGSSGRVRGGWGCSGRRRGPFRTGRPRPGPDSECHPTGANMRLASQRFGGGWQGHRILRDETSDGGARAPTRSLADSSPASSGDSAGRRGAAERARSPGVGEARRPNRDFVSSRPPDACPSTPRRRS